MNKAKLTKLEYDIKKIRGELIEIPVFDDNWNDTGTTEKLLSTHPKVRKVICKLMELHL